MCSSDVPTSFKHLFVFIPSNAIFCICDKSMALIQSIFQLPNPPFAPQGTQQGQQLLCPIVQPLSLCFAQLNISDPALTATLQLATGVHTLGNCGGPCLQLQGGQRLTLNGSASVEMGQSSWPLLRAAGNSSVTISGHVQLVNYSSNSSSLLTVAEGASLLLSGVVVRNASAPLGAALRFM